MPKPHSIAERKAPEAGSAPTVVDEAMRSISLDTVDLVMANLKKAASIVGACEVSHASGTYDLGSAMWAARDLLDEAYDALK